MICLSTFSEVFLGLPFIECGGWRHQSIIPTIFDLIDFGEKKSNEFVKNSNNE